MNRNVFAAAVAALFLAAASTAWAQSPDFGTLPGTWLGQVADSKGRPVSLVFSLTSVKLGDDSGTVRWGGTLQCKTGLQVSGVGPRSLELVATSGSGGACDTLRNGYATVTREASGTDLTFTFGKDGKTLYTATLKHE
ncbi:MAG: hypothetical protein M0006_07630 [Magnetospirillum sp.]|nr:hypothetical protein [Magnetospirillum sp.]